MKKLIYASITSEFHYLGLASFITSNGYDTKDNQLILFINFHSLSNGFRFEENSITFKNLTVTITKVYNQNESHIFFLKYVKSGKYSFNEILLINVMNPDYKLIFLLKFQLLICNIKLILLDEGFGMYLTKELWDKSIQPQEKTNKTNSRFILFLRRVVLFALKVLILKDLLFKKEIFLFDRSRNGLVARKDNVSSFQNYLNTLPQFFKIDKNSIVIFSAVLPYQLIDTEKEIYIYQEVINRLLVKFPFHTIYFKPHPIEYKSLSKFYKLLNCKLIEININAEYLLLKNRFELVVGSDSTALISAAILFELKVYSFSKDILYSFVDKISKEKINQFIFLTKKIDNIKFIL